MTNYTSIFKGTIRAHEWKGQYANHILVRQLELAPKGTIKVHGFTAGVSHEPPAEELAVSAAEAMLKALHLFAPRADYVSLP